MCAKYSAEWWEKFPDINREISSRRDPSRIVDDLIQETASGRPSPTGKSERSRAGSQAPRGVMSHKPAYWEHGRAMLARLTGTLEIMEARVSGL